MQGRSEQLPIREVGNERKGGRTRGRELDLGGERGGTEEGCVGQISKREDDYDKTEKEEGGGGGGERILTMFVRRRDEEPLDLRELPSLCGLQLPALRSLEAHQVREVAIENGEEETKKKRMRSCS